MRVSVDTRHASVAEAAVAAGATLVNDVSASLQDVAAAGGAGWVAMHMLGEPRTMQVAPTYDDVVAEVRAFLRRTGRRPRRRAGVAGGLGRPRHRLRQDDRATTSRLLRHLDELAADGCPVLVGTSRKRFLGQLTGGAPVDDRVEASVATALWAVERGAAMVRVHDVAPVVQALRIAGDAVAVSS